MTIAGALGVSVTAASGHAAKREHNFNEYGNNTNNGNKFINLCEQPCLMVTWTTHTQHGPDPNWRPY